MILNGETPAKKITCERNTKDTSEVGEGIDPDCLLFAHLNITAVICVFAVVRIDIVGGGGGPHQHGPAPEGPDSSWSREI